MILGEKIASLRKKNHWSQEELAEKLEVSRQSVSKWESSASIPELEKILKMSNLFKVSTDYLLKDDMTQEFPEREDLSGQWEARKVSVETVQTFLKDTEVFAQWISTGIALCIISPAAEIILSGICESDIKKFPQNMAELTGVVVMFVLIAAAVAIFILKGIPYGKYDYLEKEVITVEYGVTGIVRRKKEEFADTFRKKIAFGVLLCVLCVIPVIIIDGFGLGEVAENIGVAILLIMVATGVRQIVWAGIIQGGFQRILQEEDYSVERKQLRKQTELFSKIYWCTVVAIFLAFSFWRDTWETSWVIFPVAAVLFAAVTGIVEWIITRKKK